MKTKIEIKSIWGEVLFSFEKENNTIKDTVEEAVRHGASLNRANLYGASLDGANLNGASLDGASLNRANLYGATNIPYIPLACPSDGAFTGWKKVADKLVQLEIPADARRYSATTRKCRCDKAKVIAITSLDGKTEFTNVKNTAYDPHIEYSVGCMVYPDSFDDNRWKECSHGIYFFINKQEAINY